MTSYFKGGIDGLFDGSICGWISPADAITIEHQNKTREIITPNVSRLDVVTAGASSHPNVGFRYPLHWSILQQQSLRFLLKINNNDVDIPNSPFNLKAAQLQANQLRELLALPPFHLFEVIPNGDDITFVGCLIPHARNTPLNLELHVNGVPFEDIEWHDVSSQSAGIRNFFWYLPVETAFFRATIKEGLKNENRSFRIQPVLAESKQPVNPFYFLEVPVKTILPEMPEDYRQKRVVAWADDFKFWLTGYSHMNVIKELITTYKPDMNLAEMAYLDWGCGCARITRHFLEGEPCFARVVGTDIDASNIEWCKNMLKKGEFYTTNTAPPLPFEDNSFDVIAANSVFTHLDEEHQNLWLTELRRILKPNGLALLTTNQESSFSHASASLDLIEKWKKSGIFVNGINHNLENVIEDASYYKDTFHTKNYIKAHWSQYMEILDIQEMLFGYQDVVILKKSV